MSRVSLIAAIGTPLTPEQDLHQQGLRLHLEDCWTNGMTGVLAGGTMGLMQLLTPGTYRSLVEVTVEQSTGRGEIFVGAGDTSLARTWERLRFLNDFPLAGVVVLPPFFVSFGQNELLKYYKALADFSESPIFLYDLPTRTRTRFCLETIVELSKHPNIQGIKVSESPAWGRQLREATDPAFRVILAAPELMDVFIRSGFREHLDGMHAIAPAWVSAIARLALNEEWAEAAAVQQKLTALRDLIVPCGVFPAFTAIMNARGIPGNFAPEPFIELAACERDRLLAHPLVDELIRQYPVEPSATEA